MSETFTFKVRAGAALVMATDLILAPDRVRLGDRELSGTAVDWIRINPGMKVNGSNTSRAMELGNSTTSLKFRLPDVFFSLKTNEAPFSEIASILVRFYGPRIVGKMIDTLAGGGSFEVGKLRFTPSRVVIPKTKYLFFSDKPEEVPWARVICSQGTDGGPYLLDSASHHEAGKVSSALLGPHAAYSTKRCETLWAPNACLVPTLVELMQQHPEISGGLWYALRNGQKLGPFSWSQLQQMAAGGLLQGADMVLQEGSAKGSAAASIAGLFAAEYTGAQQVFPNTFEG